MSVKNVKSEHRDGRKFDVGPDVPVDRKKWLGPLQDLMLECCRPVDGERSITILAKQLQITTAALYRIIKAERISGTRARKLSENVNGKVPVSAFAKYVFVDSSTF